ncbi:Beta-xylanase [Microbacterium sp. 8M]|uniref:endo-1,4-beta-xylanase n=1 Tax=Microbacterium sp. 8M TaxID=2653153 RepID=UPI0012F01D3A|nr:endo-1,4-beta-xylanase [Microbacterium sp. 8M]VXB83207.1 Beta-xylanase [Microbacterium sp. 8M]
MRRSTRLLLAVSTAAALVLPVCGAAAAEAAPPSHSRSDKSTLRAQAPKDLAIGTAVWGQKELVGYDPAAPTEYQQVLGAQFSSLTPENDMKWESVHPSADVYDFASADALVAYAKDNHQQVRGHTLLWHSQNPAWVTEASKTWTCDDARAVLHDHISTVVGHFKGEIYQWDVANEIFQDTWDAGGVRLRTEANPFLKACASDPIALLEDAFRWAHEADPDAVLFLNDYNAEGINAKTDAYYALVQRMLADGAPVGGFGAQAHLSLQYGYDTTLQANFERFAALGLQVAVTEADVRIPLLPGETAPTAEQVATQTDRYDAMLQACLNVSACTSFTVWGFPDANSWVPAVFPGEGWATIFEDDYTPKPAFTAMLRSLEDATPGRSPRR